MAYLCAPTTKIIKNGFFFSKGVSTQIGNACGLGMVGKYFDRRRSAANGLAMSGVSLGVIVFPPILRWLLDTYTYKGAALVVAGVSLNSVVCGALMRPTENPRPRKQASVDRSAIANATSERNLSGSVRDRHAATNDVIYMTESASSFKQNAFQSRPVQEQPTVSSSSRHSTYSNAAYIREMETGLSEFPHTVGTGSSVSAVSLNTKRNHSLVRRVSVAFRTFVLKDSKHRPPDNSDSKKDNDGLGLFKNPLLAFVQVFMFLSTTGSECMLQYYPAAASEGGMSDYQTAFLLSIVGIGDLISRLCLGALGDCHLMKPYKMVTIPLFVLGTACTLSRFATEFYSQVIFAVVIGLTYGVAYAYHGVLLVDFFGLQNLSRLLGISNFVCGVSLATGSPFIGKKPSAFGFKFKGISYKFLLQVMRQFNLIF